MPQGGVQQLCQKLNKHWTNIAHHLYLKHECPVPLPAVGPLAELLSVTRQVATDINALVLTDSLTPSCVSTLTKERCVKLLGKLIGWLQQQPHEQLLLNTEQQESLWQLLLITLANMLRVVSNDAEHAPAFLTQLHESGMVPSLSPAVYWLLQHHPRRCLTASAGAWLLLQELLISSTTTSRSCRSSSTTAADSNSSSAAAVAELAVCLPQLGPVLQCYIDQAYQTLRRPAGGRLSGSGSVKKHSKEGGSSSSTGGAEAHQSSSSGSNSSTDVAAAVAAVEDGSWARTHPVCLTDDPSSAPFRNLLALLHALQAHILDLPLAAAAAAAVTAHAGAADQQQQQAVPVVPAKAYLQVLAVANMWLHDNAAAAAGGSDSSTSSSSASIPADHLQVLPVKAVAAAAAYMLGMNSSAAALHSISRACEALQGGLFDLKVDPKAANTSDRDAPAAAETSDDQAAATAAAVAETSESDNPAAAAAATATDGAATITASEGDQSGAASEEPVTPTVEDAAAAAVDANLAWDTVDSVSGFKLLLEAVALLQRHGQSMYLALPLQQLAASAHGCSRQEMQQLIVTRGQLLLRILSEYLMHAAVDDVKQEAQEEQQQTEGEKCEQQLVEGGSGNAERCVLCAHVLIQMCPGHLAAGGGMLGSHGLVDDQLLGALTEQDPARFYAIMDHLVRNVQPQNLQVLLPMSASFLTRSLHTEEQSGEQTGSSSSIVPAVAADDSDAAATAGSLLKGGSYTARTKKSMVILSDYAVCRSFAAALHGYSKSVLGPVLSQQQQQEGDTQQNSGSGEQVQQQQQEQETPVHYVLPPLQKVAEWLAVGLEDAIITALQGQEEEPATAGQADSNGKPKSPKKKAAKQQQQQQQLSPQDIAAQVQSASQAAACGLVLVALLARAAVPVLQELQQALQQLPAAKLAADYRGAVTGDASAGDGLIAELGAIDLLSGLMFVRAAYQALCARCYLTQVLNGLPARLFHNGKAAAGTEAAAEDAAALTAVKAALRGDGLARGWAHLVQPVPLGVTGRVRNFQKKHPGDFVASLSLLQRLVPVNVIAADAAQQQQAQEPSTAEGEADAVTEAVVFKLPGQLKSQLAALLDDLLDLFGSLLSEVPLPVGCNNPACTNLEGVAEASLSVNKRCKNCLAAHYCSKQCQTEHWLSHKAACSRVKVMTAG